MKYLLMNNPDWNNAIEGIPLGIFEGNLEIWALYKNIKVYELNEKGITGEVVKDYGEGSFWTDGEGVYFENNKFFCELPRDLSEYFFY